MFGLSFFAWSCASASSIPVILAWTMPQATHCAEFAMRHSRVSSIRCLASDWISCSRERSSSA